MSFWLVLTSVLGTVGDAVLRRWADTRAGWLLVVLTSVAL